jgi:hypothetical protein
MALCPPLNFLTLHYFYFIATSIIASIIFYVTSTSWRSVAYVDSIFMCISAMTGAGLNTVWTQFPIYPWMSRLIIDE